MPLREDAVDTVLDYHLRTKHHLHRYAASLGYLDWNTQPDPFRTFEGAPAFDLPLSAGLLAVKRYDDLYVPGTVQPAPVNLDTIATLLELALGLSAWKQSGEARWALRCNPSSGNLHPTEGYVLLPGVPGLSAGVYHYLSRDHRLERRCAPTPEDATRLGGLLGGSFLAGLSSIHWREAWKYGERAFRYCQHDVGHAIASLRVAAAALGWKARMVDASDETIDRILGLHRQEDVSGADVVDEADREHPDVLLVIGPDVPEAIDIVGVQEALNSGVWTGKPNRLSPEHFEWPVIGAVAAAARRPDSVPVPTIVAAASYSARSVEPRPLLAATIIRQRRSAVAFDDSTSISANAFYRILERLLPLSGAAPWDVLPWTPHLHCGIFVHRIAGLAPGLYLLLRNPGSYNKVRAAMNPAFIFERPQGCPTHLPLFTLTAGDFRHDAQIVSCRQKIAGAGAFSLGMIAEFGEGIRAIGAWWYRRLFWESGVLGQILYLEAEAAGVRGTGIGCYFDDAFHGVLGLKGDQFQSLYHFTVGGPVEDPRIQTIPAYAHLSASRLLSSTPQVLRA